MTYMATMGNGVARGVTRRQLVWGLTLSAGALLGMGRWHTAPSVKRIVMKGVPKPTTRLESFAQSQGANSWIDDLEIDEWYARQAMERDRQTREALLHKIQQKPYDEARVVPIWELSFLGASGGGIGLGPDPVIYRLGAVRGCAGHILTEVASS
jgi:ABC-type transport system substrate-binding protein